MRIVLLQPIIKGKETFNIGQKLTFPDSDAITLIQRGIAKPFIKKEYNTLLEKVKKAQELEEQNKIKAYAIMKQQQLKESAKVLAEELQNTFELIADDEFRSLLLMEHFGIVSGVEE